MFEVIVEKGIKCLVAQRESENRFAGVSLLAAVVGHSGVHQPGQPRRHHLGMNTKMSVIG